MVELIKYEHFIVLFSMRALPSLSLKKCDWLNALQPGKNSPVIKQITCSFPINVHFFLPYWVLNTTQLLWLWQTKNYLEHRITNLPKWSPCEWHSHRLQCFQEMFRWHVWLIEFLYIIIWWCRPSMRSFLQMQRM